MSYEPLHHKYRPQTFAHLVGQEAIAKTLINAIRTERIAPAYLFTGPRGTGKTSSARILAKSLNCKQQQKPTESPCGVCEVCRTIAGGSALDVTEIDAASNTGVDNIREIIERAQFAPVQCRYKVYVIDECLTGDSLVQTSDGLIRIDDPSIQGKTVLSYNDATGAWEFRKVVRWLDQGVRQTLVIKTTNREIRCTGNHLIRTDAGWIPAKDVKEGTKILSPVNVAVAPSFTNTGRMGVFVDLLEATSLKEIHTGKKTTTWPLSLSKLNPCDPYVPVGVENDWISLSFYKKKATGFKAFNHDGKSIPTKKVTESGIFVQKNSSPIVEFCNQTNWDSFTAPYLGTVPSLTLTRTVDFPDYAGHTEKSSRNGWNTRSVAFQSCNQSLKLHQTEDTGTYQFAVTPPVTLSSRMSLTLFSPMEEANWSLWSGSTGLPQKGWLGGTWMMAPSLSLQKEAHQFNFTQKDTLGKKIKLLSIGLQKSVIPLEQSFTPGVAQAKHTTTHGWGQTPLENGWQTLNSIQSPQWITNLEIVESVKVAGVERVYDIEVENNHNFVANRLLVHNCHMLSGAAFNALLKTLEEPPKHVVFVLATTDPQRVLPTIISRCQRFDFRRIPLESMVSHLSAIASNENINISHDAITLVSQVAQGGLRDAESLLDQLSLLPEQVTVEAVWDLVGAVPERDLLALTQAIASDNSETVLEQCRHLMDRGREPLVVLQNLAGFYRDLLIAKTAPKRQDLVAVTPPTWKELCEFAQQFETSDILQGQQHLKNSEAQIKNTTQPRLWLEVTLLGLLPSAIRYQVIETSTTSPRTPTVKRTEIVQSVKPENRQISPSSLPNQMQHEQPSVPDVSDRTVTAAIESGASVAVNPAASVSGNQSQTHPSRSQSAHQDVVPHQGNAQVDELEQVWQNVLNHIKLLSTKELLRQHCRLVSFDGSQVTVGVSSKGLLSLAQDKLPEIQGAFESIYNCSVHVILQLLNSKAATTTPAAKVQSNGYENVGQREPIASRERSTSQTVTIESVSPPVGTKPVTNYQPIESVRSVPSNRGQTLENETPVREAERSPVQFRGVSEAHPQTTVTPQIQQEADPYSLIAPVTPSLIPLEDWDVDAVEKAMGTLKQFFEGEIVELTDDLPLGEPVSDRKASSEEEIEEITPLLEPPIEEELISTEELDELDSDTDSEQESLPLGNGQDEYEDDIPF